MVEEKQDGHYLLQPSEENGWDWVKLDRGKVMPEPTLALHPDVAELLMEGIAEEIVGVEDPREKQSKAEGKLEATERHLEDLRSLVGLDDESSKRNVEVEVGE